MKRREFLQSAAAASVMPAIPFSISVADAAGPIAPAADEAGYKALVCVFLFGGNDNHNTVVPFQGAEYTAYSAARGGLASNNGLALPQSSLDSATQRLGTTGLALHPAMTRLASLYNSNKMAVVANCGPLLDETTLAQYRTPGFPLPPQLFSHSDMQMHWQTMIPDEPADTGWGGRLADVFRLSASGRLPVGIALANGGLFMKGRASVPYSVTPVRYSNGAVNLKNPIARAPNAAISWNWTGSLPQEVFKENYGAARANLLEQQYAKNVRASLEIGEFVRDAMYTQSGDDYSFKNNPNGALDIARWSATNPLAAQLHSVAAMIAARSALGTRRQVFFVSIGGFDNHGDQFGTDTSGNRTLLAGKHFQLLSWVDEALKLFYDATVNMGVADNVTTMTMSDFGRTIKSNGQGSDHGWGGHYFVLGGKVNGGRFFGAPTPGAAISTDAAQAFPFASQLAARQLDVGEGRLLPTVSSDAYAATLARWLGADNNEIAAVFPNLQRFNQQSINLML